MAEAVRKYTGDYINYTPSSAVAYGEVVVISSDLCGVAEQAIPANTKGALAITGIFEMAKEASLAISAGDRVYWDASNNVVNKTNTNPYLGVAVEDAAASDSTVVVLLNKAIE